MVQKKPFHYRPIHFDKGTQATVCAIRMYTTKRDMFSVTLSKSKHFYDLLYMMPEKKMYIRINQ